MDNFETALSLLPSRYLELCRRSFRGAEEFRLRVGRRMFVVCGGREHALPGDPLSEGELLRCLEKATGASLHSAAPAMAGGYLPYMGLRIGLCGTAVQQGADFKGFRHFSSLSIRIPRECRGACDSLYHQLFAGGFVNTLLLSPPGGGKTTALRELIRLLSEAGTRLAVVDERGEIAACDGCAPGFDLGEHTDVLSGCTKPEGAMMLLRGMNPQVLAMDEITRPEDLAAVKEVCGCGVGLLATAHATDREDLSRRPIYRELLELGVFQRAAVIRQRDGKRFYEAGSLASWA